MAYGLQVFNSNDNILIDTSLKTQMQITEITTHAAASNHTQEAQEFTCWNYNGSISTVFNQSYNSSDIYNNSSSTTFNVLRLREVTSTTPTGRPANDYGIETFNASGTVSFSDLFTKSYRILHIYPPGTVLGNTTIFSGTVGSNIYVGAGSPSNGSSFSWGNFVFTSSSIAFKNFVNFAGTTINQYNGSVVMVIEIRN